jgi:hypothetical protein
MFWIRKNIQYSRYKGFWIRTRGILVVLCFSLEVIHAQDPEVIPQALTIAKAEELVRRSTDKTGVDLDRLLELNIDVARVLSKSRGMLSLNRIRTMDVQTAKALTSESKLVLRLNGIEELSPQAAACLARASYLELNRLRPDRETLRELGKCKGALHLNHLESLDTETASFLAEGPFVLQLNGVSEVNADVARSLATCKGTLGLDGISQLSDQAAEELSKHVGGLSLASLRRLSHVGLSQQLVVSRGGVVLGELEEVSLECLETFVSEEFTLKLGIREVRREQAEILARFQGRLTLTRVPSLDQATINVLLKSNGKLTCSGLRKLEDIKLAERLANDSSQMFGSPNLESLTESIARAITRKKVILPLYKLEEIDLQVAAILAAHKGHLILTGLRQMSDEQAEVFAAREGTLRLSRKMVISEQAKAILEGNKRISWGG